ILPKVFGILGVTKRPQDVHALTVVVNSGNQPVLIAAEIENCHDAAARHRYCIGVWVNAPHILKVFPFCLSKKPMPVLQWFCCIGMSLSEFTESLARNDAH